MARKRHKKLSKATIFGAILLTVVLCGTLSYKQKVMGTQEKEYSAQIKELQKQNKELKEEKEDLKDLEEYVKTDEYAEEVAREKFGLVYKGEIIFKPEDEQ
ncbi:MAG: septum formation initiator family protein [Butyribacter sp.]|nr:septum formation initiator family protein [bacterium]MDY3853883.1 septum formation initiator family protein [Butyribacter sp.]